jgi:glycosyltransferase involved in cell wall biosynthesis
MKNILFIVPYPPGKAPSQRFRFEQYISFLETQNVRCEISPFIDTSTWAIFYLPGKTFLKFFGILKGFLRRIGVLFRLSRYDALFIHREACFIGPPFFEWLYAKVFRKKILFDFDDAIWLHDVSEVNSNLGWLKSPSKTGVIARYATLVTAGNKYLASYASHFNKNVVVIPTTIDTDYHIAKQKHADTLTIGWTGSTTTIKHFEWAAGILRVIKQKYPTINIRVISNKAPELDLDIDFVPWKKESEIEDLAVIDIGIMPLPDNDWAKGKCGFKGLQYMSLCIPTVMSPVGVNTEIIRDGENGFLAGSETEWIAKISALIESAELRKKLGNAGRETILAHYSIQSQKQKYLALFDTI